MTRKEITKYLTDLLIKEKLSDRKYYAREVTLDYGSSKPRRVDVMEFTPDGVMCTADIEKGKFTCYEVKSCREDVYSGNGLNFYGEQNYIVMTVETYITIQQDLLNGMLDEHICRFMGVKTCPEYGILVPIPRTIDVRDSIALFKEFECPSTDYSMDWKFWKAIPQTRDNHRTRSMTELLFCMLRAKHSYTNRGME